MFGLTCGFRAWGGAGPSWYRHVDALWVPRENWLPVVGQLAQLTRRQAYRAFLELKAHGLLGAWGLPTSPN
jgi:hypothetical protein